MGYYFCNNGVANGKIYRNWSNVPLKRVYYFCNNGRTDIKNKDNIRKIKEKNTTAFKTYTIHLKNEFKYR